MKLLSLNLKNFRQHRATTLQFGEGLIGIVGSNGAGKTTLVEAIAFALYGARVIRGRIDDVRTRGVATREPCSVSILFEHAGSIWRVDRDLDDASLYQGGEAAPEVSGTREVSTRVGTLLGMSHEEFLATYFTEQKGLEFLGGKRGAAERERFVMRMLGLDRLEDVQERVRAERRDVRLEVSAIQNTLGDRAVRERAVIEEEKRVHALVVRHQELVRVAERAQEEAETSARELENRIPLLKEIETLRRSVHECRIRLNERMREERGIEAKLATFRNQRDAAEWIDVADCLNELKALELHRDNLQSEIEARTHRYLDQRRQIKDALEAAHSEKSKLQARVQPSHALPSENRCPTCGQELSEKRNHSHQHALEENENVIAALRKSLEESLLEPEESRDELVRITSKLSSLQEQLARSEHQRVLERSLSELEESLTAVRRERGQLEDQLHALEAEEARYRDVEGEISKARHVAESKQRLAEVARLQRVRSEGEVGTQKALLERASEELCTFEVRAQKLAESEARLALLEQSDRTLTEFRKEVSANIRPRLAELASDFLTELTDGRYTAVELGSDYSPTVLQDGEAKPVISGGELDILNLCMRLALSQLLAERSGHAFSLIVLDEVFGSLDEGRRNNVLDLLEKLRSRFEQILIITHLDDIKDAVQSLIYISYDEATGILQVGEAAAVFEDVAAG